METAACGAGVAAAATSVGSVPIIILSGFLGAGKTTVLKHILETSASDVRLGCVVNDLAKVNVDEATLSHVTTASQASFVSLASGCVCCDGGAGFASSLDALNSARVATDGAAAAAPFDAIVVECTGVADPQRAALDFASACAASKHAWTASLELPPRVVTVVDGVAFWAQWDSSLREATGKRPVHAELLAKQVEVAHALVLNKASELRSERECTLLHRLLRSMNRDAAIVRVDFGRVDMSWLLTASTQQEQQQQRAPTAPPPPSRYGISSFVYTNCNRPLHPLRLMERVIKRLPVRSVRRVQSALADARDGLASSTAADDDDAVLPPPSPSAETAAASTATAPSPPTAAAPAAAASAPWERLVRSKGDAWLASVPEQEFTWSQAGVHFSLRDGGAWAAGKRPASTLVLIGVDLDASCRDAMTRELDSCALNDLEWAAFTTRAHAL